ncbi:site-2 protease family protein [Candidatus Berkelbacteria bacterium]|nr:site-2 protease family protein [Candidatus Berkelbacteria bacterium]
MTLILTILLFILIFGIVIIIHEAGHFLVARREGMRVKEFAFGFPPRIFSKRKGQTRYTFNSIPLGGYVSILGEEEESEAKDSFNKKKPMARLRVVLAGIGMNFILAWVLLILYFWVAPFGPKIDAVAVANVYAGSPAEAAGIKMNDFIVSANGTLLTSDEILGEFTRAHRGEAVTLVIRSQGKEKALTVQLSADEKAPLGVAIADVGALPTIPWYLAPWHALVEMFNVTVAVLGFLGQLIVKIFGVSTSASIQAVSGPVGIFSQLKQIMILGAPAVVHYAALISLAVGIFNLLPIPALDGGRAIFLFFESIFGKRALSHATEAWVHAIGFFVLILIIIVVTYFDIQRLG